MSFNYDVWVENGVWVAAHYAYSKFNRDFKSPEAAMQFCNVATDADFMRL
jgi:hypothetical protein